jgi:diamine N-acetyltransferase
MNLTVEVIKASQIEELRSLSIKTFVEAFQDQNTPQDMAFYINEAFDAKKLSEELEDKSSRFFFLLRDLIPIGYAKINLPPTDGPNGKEGMELQRIYIDSAHQSGGMGAFLLDYIVKFARELHIPSIWLGVWEHNPQAIRFYQKKGFQMVGAHDFMLGASLQTDYIMQLII